MSLGRPNAEKVIRDKIPEGESQYDLAGRVIGLAMKVHRALGPGFLEVVYQRALSFELARSGLSVCSDRPIDVHYEGFLVGQFKADLIVNTELIVELKAVTSLNVDHGVQLVNYLTATGINVALLINSGVRSLQFKKKFRLQRDVAEIDLQ